MDGCSIDLVHDLVDTKTMNFSDNIAPLVAGTSDYGQGATGTESHVSATQALSHGLLQSAHTLLILIGVLLLLLGLGTVFMKIVAVKVMGY